MRTGNVIGIVLAISLGTVMIVARGPHSSPLEPVNVSSSDADNAVTSQIDESASNMTAEAIVPNVNPITMQRYANLRFGMTRDQVAGVMGAPGVEQASSAGSNPLDSTSLISWTNGDGSNAVLTFEGGVLTAKSQSDLPPS